MGTVVVEEALKSTLVRFLFEATTFITRNWCVAFSSPIRAASKPKMKSHYRGHKMALWLNLIPQLHRPGDTEVSMAHHHFREKESTFFDGPIRPESFTRPRGYFGQQFVNSAEALGGGARESRQDPQIVDCLPDESMLLLADDGVTGGSLGNDDDDFGALADGEGGGGGGVLNEEEEELIQRFMRKHYFRCANGRFMTSFSAIFNDLWRGRPFGMQIPPGTRQESFAGLSARSGLFFIHCVGWGCA